MNVKLISYSKPAEGDLDARDLVAYCARVSNPSNQKSTETSDRLLSYLIRETHWSPFEMVSACLEITTTRDIARQILRQSSFSFQEFSQRYADPAADLSINLFREARMQDTKNRQNSIETEDPNLKLEWMKKQAEVAIAVKNSYEWATEKGIAKEQVRAIFPEGMTESRLYMNGTIRSWMHYIELRSGNGTQKEHREVAIACRKALEPIFPFMKKITSD